MPNEPTYMHGPAANARTQTNKFAHCQVCGVEWQVKSDDNADAQGCSFCDAPADAITILSEEPTGYGAIHR